MNDCPRRPATRVLIADDDMSFAAPSRCNRQAEDFTVVATACDARGG